MKKPVKTGYVKRTQKDYSFSFKLQVVEEIESGHLDRLVDLAEKEYDIKKNYTLGLLNASRKNTKKH